MKGGTREVVIGGTHTRVTAMTRLRTHYYPVDFMGHATCPQGFPSGLPFQMVHWFSSNHAVVW